MSTLDELKQFMNDNLVNQQEAIKITHQSKTAFSQSLTTGKIKPFFETEGKGPAKVRLYLRSDLEEYAKNKRVR